MRKLFLIAGAVLFGLTVSAQQLRGNIEGVAIHSAVAIQVDWN